MKTSYFLSADGMFEDNDPLRAIPEEMIYHCMVKIDDNTFMKVGTYEWLHDTWIYKHDAPQGTDRWTKGPSILEIHYEMYDIKCGKIQAGIQHVCLKNGNWLANTFSCR